MCGQVEEQAVVSEQCASEVGIVHPPEVLSAADLAHLLLVNRIDLPADGLKLLGCVAAVDHRVADRANLLDAQIVPVRIELKLADSVGLQVGHGKVSKARTTPLRLRGDQVIVASAPMRVPFLDL